MFGAGGWLGLVGGVCDVLRCRCLGVLMERIRRIAVQAFRIGVCLEARNLGGAESRPALRVEG